MSKASAKCQRLLYSRPEKFKSMAQIPKKGMHQLRLHSDGDISLRDAKVQAWVDYKYHGKSGWHTRSSLYQE